MIRMFLILALLFGSVPGTAMVAPTAQPAATTVKPTAERMARWVHYGADKAYTSKAAAKADAANVFRRAGWSPKAVAAMVQAMNSTAPERIELRKGMRLDFMRSGQKSLWMNVQVAFQDLENGVEVVSKADRWTVTVDGVTYQGILPDVCNNTAGVVVRADCVYVDFESRNPQETAVHYAKYNQRDDECFAVRPVTAFAQPDDGKGWVKPNEGCPGRPCDFGRINQLKGQQAARIGTVPIKPGHYQFRVKRDELLVLCLEYWGNGKRDSSFAAGVRWPMDYQQVGKQQHARVLYRSSELPKGVKLSEAKGLIWWAESEGEVQQINQSFAQLASR